VDGPGTRRSVPTQYLGEQWGDRPKPDPRQASSSLLSPRRPPALCPFSLIVSYRHSARLQVYSRELGRSASQLTKKGLRSISVADELLVVRLNWRSNFQPALCSKQAGGRRVSRRDSVLAGAGVCYRFGSLFFSCWLPQRGFFLVKRFHAISPGIIGSGASLAFWRWK